MLQEQKDIDVIIPVFNGENYIETAVHSVLAQTVLPAKLILVNDGSTDSTEKILEKIKRGNATVTDIRIITQVNKGLSAARNAGIAASGSAYLAFLDADDCWLPGKLEAQLKIFSAAAFENTGLVYCNYSVIDETGNPNPDAEITEPRKEIRGMVFEKLLHGNLISGSGSGVLVRRECFDKAGMFDEQLKAFEDWDMWLRIARHYAFDYSNEILVQIRMHSRSMQKNASHMNTNALRFYKKWIGETEDKEILRKWAFRIAKPAYVNGRNKEYLSAVRQAFSKEEIKKLFSKTFGSIGLYVFLKRLKPS